MSIRDDIYSPAVFAGVRTNDFIAIARPEGIYGKGCALLARLKLYLPELAAAPRRLIYGRAAPVIA